MNERDREYIEDIAKRMGQMPGTFSASVVIRLWGIIDRLDKQLTGIVEAGEFLDEKEIISLLERWVEKFKNLPDVSYGMWLRDSAKAENHHGLFSLLTETKTLLKEASGCSVQR